jgi:hypothetical protein
LTRDVPAKDAGEKVADPVKEDVPPWDREGESPSLVLPWPRFLAERRMPNGTYGGVRGGGM